MVASMTLVAELWRKRSKKGERETSGGKQQSQLNSKRYVLVNKQYQDK